LVILKKKTFGYSERNKKQRENFLKELESINPGDVVYLDEFGMDDNDVKSRGWAKKGKRLHAIKKSQRAIRISVIGSLNLKKLIAPFLFEGYCTRDVFEVYLKKTLIPQLRAGQVLIIDNAAFHKGGKIKQLIESVGCRLLYLPTYSPDLNPIEKYWFVIKNKIRKLLENSNIYDAAISVLGDA